MQTAPRPTGWRQSTAVSAESLDTHRLQVVVGNWFWEGSRYMWDYFPLSQKSGWEDTRDPTYFLVREHLHQ